MVAAVRSAISGIRCNAKVQVVLKFNEQRFNHALDGSRKIEELDVVSRSCTHVTVTLTWVTALLGTTAHRLDARGVSFYINVGMQELTAIYLIVELRVLGCIFLGCFTKCAWPPERKFGMC